MKNASMPVLVLMLCLICAVVAVLLGLVNSVTEEPIAVIQAEKTANAMNQVLEAENYEPLDYTGDDGQITGLHKADDLGYVVELTVGGSQGDISLVVGVDTAGAVTGLSVIAHKETPGLGDKVAKPGDVQGDALKAAIVGTTGTAAVDKDGGAVASLAGATVTSRAIVNAANSAVAAVATVG